MKKQTFVRKRGLGKHLFKDNGQTHIVGAGEKVTCDPEALGKHIENYTCLDKDFKVEKEEQPTLKYVLPIIVQRDRSGYVDIFNPMYMEKPLNSKGLRRKEAEKILEKYLSISEEQGPLNVDNYFSWVPTPKKRRRIKKEKE